MLHEFLSANRDEIIARTRAKVANRTAPRPTETELENGIPMFLTQLVEMLQSSHPEFGEARIDTSASRHGEDLLRKGFTVGQVVQDYGGLCQAITDLAVESSTSITSDEFRILNGCLDGAVASAVSEFGRQREKVITDQGAQHLGVLAHELRNALNTATLAFTALQSGAVGVSGSTSGVVMRSLTRMRHLLDRSFAAVRLNAGIQRSTNILVSELLEELAIGAAVEAAHRGLQRTGAPVADGVTVHADPEILVSASSNLLQNAFKVYARARSHVTNNAYDRRSSSDRNRG